MQCSDVRHYASSILWLHTKEYWSDSSAPCRTAYYTVDYIGKAADVFFIGYSLDWVYRELCQLESIRASHCLQLLPTCIDWSTNYQLLRPRKNGSQSRVMQSTRRAWALNSLLLARIKQDTWRSSDTTECASHNISANMDQTFALNCFIWPHGKNHLALHHLDIRLAELAVVVTSSVNQDGSTAVRSSRIISAYTYTT